MNETIDRYWRRRLEDCAKALDKNGFSAVVVPDVQEACETAWKIIEQTAPAVVGFADSRTMHACGIIDRIRKENRIRLIDGFGRSRERSENLRLRREALLSDVFLTGVNAMTEDGRLVWLDMVGNRIAAVTFGPSHVILFAGRNKLSGDEQAARRRVKELAAPINARAHEAFRTPCRITSRCHDCASPDRICNSWLIMEKCYPLRRITVILINEDLGY